MGAVVLLSLGVVSLFVRPRPVPLWAGPTACAVAGLLTLQVPRGAAVDALQLLRNPLLFLVFAVPLAIGLDRVGVFAALAAAVDGGRHLVASLWVLAALVTAVLNLDAAVVLLTPLYIRIALRHGLSPEMLAFQPALLACLASGPLPVSNLTNLIVAEQHSLHATDFLVHMGPPTVVAVVVGWWCFRRCFHLHPVADRVDEPVDRRALRRGLPVVALVVVGFTLGDVWGVPAWIVAAVAWAWVALLTREVRWRAAPLEAILVAAALSVLVAGALPHLGLHSVLAHDGFAGAWRALTVGVVGSDLTNNLPTVLAAGDLLHDRAHVWPLLVGVNIGPVLVLSGALSGLLWRDTARRLGVSVTARRYTVVGVEVGLPALVAAAATVFCLS
ncbi:MAG TPA: SLC13 family permease [Ilumatobacteraceae bacterium]|nr:SLC13 family permease [Ilumatobacteraceae bacterium]